MSLSTLHSENSLNWLFSEFWVTKTVGDVRELLIISPLDFVPVSSIVIIMSSSWSILEVLLEVDLLSLREPSTGWLSPSVVELKVHVCEMEVSVLHWSNLRVLCWNVALLLQILWSDLGDVQVNQVGIVSVDLHKLVLIFTINVDVVLNLNVLVG